jgi:cytochrome b involved in lipid metabolism
MMLKQSKSIALTAVLCLLLLSTVTGVSWNELALHATSSDCWTVVDDIVYDITNYIPSHPRRGGGPDIVVGMCGIDGTALYNTAHSQEHYYLDAFSSITNLGPIVLEGEPTTIATTPGTTPAATT